MIRLASRLSVGIKGVRDFFDCPEDAVGHGVADRPNQERLGEAGSLISETFFHRCSVGLRAVAARRLFFPMMESKNVVSPANGGLSCDALPCWDLAGIERPLYFLPVVAHAAVREADDR